MIKDELVALMAKMYTYRKKKDGNRGKFISSNLVIIFCYKEFEKFALCKSVSQSEVNLLFFWDNQKRTCKN